VGANTGKNGWIVDFWDANGVDARPEYIWIGNNLDAIINKVTVYDYAKVGYALDKTMADTCTALPGQAACTICPAADTKTGTSNVGTCLCSCLKNQYYNTTTGTCTACSYECATCWGSSQY